VLMNSAAIYNYNLLVKKLVERAFFQDSDQRIVLDSKTLARSL
jgi:hypothetical protein